MTDIHTKHLELVHAVNAATTKEEHQIAEARLRGFREAAEAIGQNVGLMMMAADMHYIDQGIDRPMCCGVFLDWSPSR